MIDVTMPDGTSYEIKNLLGAPNSNTKLAKSRDTKYRVVGLSLAPHKMSGFNVCPKATPGCIASCIFNSGLSLVYKGVNRARIAKTIAWFRKREEFKVQLLKELANNQKAAIKAGRKLAVRLNVFSDIKWEQVFPEIFTQFPKVQFYDYTKQPARLGNTPSNYHLTLSRSENNQIDCYSALLRGYNVAVVFKDKAIPKQWNVWKVINGDKSDLRFLDRGRKKAPVVVGLYAKAKGKQDVTGFIVENE